MLKYLKGLISGFRQNRKSYGGLKMESKLTKYTKELKVQKWTELVINCNSSGMSKAEWCRENNIL